MRMLHIDKADGDNQESRINYYEEDEHDVDNEENEDGGVDDDDEDEEDGGGRVAGWSWGQFQ